uniref:Uncharacterized protein n=1 Tax=Arundo donax TaxID=35708 RepID=A0A0A9E9Y3_ARUDO
MPLSLYYYTQQNWSIVLSVTCQTLVTEHIINFAYSFSTYPHVFAC